MRQKYEFKSIVAETLLIPLYMRAKEREPKKVAGIIPFYMTRLRNGWRTVWNTIIPSSTGQS